MLEKMLLICLLAFAIMTVSAANIRWTIVYMAIFSLIMSLAYLYYKAPDVAIAEAVIGSAMATVLYLVAIRKQDRLTVCLLDAAGNRSEPGEPGSCLSPAADGLLREMRAHFRHRRITLQLLRSDEPLETLLDQQFHDLLLVQDGNRLTVYGRPSDYRLDEIEGLVADSRLALADIRVVRCEKAGACDA